MSTNTVTNSTLSAARKRDEMLEPYEWKRSRTVLRREGASNRPDLVDWSDTGRIQLNEEVTVTLTHEIDLGLFAGFGSFPITLRADATGKSEVYWK